MFASTPGFGQGFLLCIVTNNRYEKGTDPGQDSSAIRRAESDPSRVNACPAQTNS